MRQKRCQMICKFGRKEPNILVILNSLYKYTFEQNENTHRQTLNMVGTSAINSRNKNVNLSPTCGVVHPTKNVSISKYPHM